LGLGFYLQQKNHLLPSRYYKKSEAHPTSNIREILDVVFGLVDEDSPHQVAGLRKIFTKSSNDLPNQF
jgi:hypothetical protein